MAFFDELKRRKVFRVTSLYAVTAWGACLGAAELFPTFGLPDESVRWFVIGAFSLLPVVALLAWVYELTPGGIERDSADRPDATTRLAPQRAANELTASWRDQNWTFQKTFTIGRDLGCELHIDDPKISRRHARVVAQNQHWHLEDLGSSNGTSVNGELVTRTHLTGTAKVTLYQGGDEIILNIKAPDGVATVLAESPTENAITRREADAGPHADH